MLNGNLKDFPLPEVLLFIGKREGRLRLFDVPDSAEMWIYVADGAAHALHLAGSVLTDSNEMITLLSVIVESGRGKFEFHDQSIEKTPNDKLFEINQLVMSLVMHVDVKLSMKRAVFSPKDIYILVTPPPEITIDPHLKLFYDQVQESLTAGVRCNQLAEELGLELDLVILNLTYLRQLGFVKIIGLSDTKNLPAAETQKLVSGKADGYALAAEASKLIVRTSKLIMKTGKLWQVTPPVPSSKKTGRE